jgi:hypothetical protein
LIAAEQRVNPRVRDAVGEIALVPPDQRIGGPGASFVMAAFTHRNPRGSRFSDGSYGVYYAARALRTAVRETAFHFARFAADARDAPRYADMRALVGRLDARLADLASLPAEPRAALLAPDSYAASRPFGAALRARGASGIVYPSVRDPGGQCVAIFTPRAVGVPLQTTWLRYHWDGARVCRYFDYASGVWHALP